MTWWYGLFFKKPRFKNFWPIMVSPLCVCHPTWPTHTHPPRNATVQYISFSIKLSAPLNSMLETFKLFRLWVLNWIFFILCIYCILFIVFLFIGTPKAAIDTAVIWNLCKCKNHQMEAGSRSTPLACLPGPVGVMKNGEPRRGHLKGNVGFLATLSAAWRLGVVCRLLKIVLCSLV